MKYYRVKYGYGKDDFYSVDEDELPGALRAQVNGGIFVCSEGTISGNNIMAVSPDYNRLMGYHRDYMMSGEDYNRLSVSTQRGYTALLEESKLALSGKENLRLN